MGALRDHNNHLCMQDAYEALKLAAGDTASPIDVGSVNDKVCWAASSPRSIETRGSLHVSFSPYCDVTEHPSMSRPNCELTNAQVFVNVATGGFGAEITESTDSGLKDTLGGASYLLTGLTSPQKLSAKCDVACGRWRLRRSPAGHICDLATLRYPCTAQLIVLM